MSSIAYGFVAWPACNPNLSKVGAAARNAQCETDNSNSDRSEGSRRGAVVTPEAHEMPLCLVHKSTFPSLLLLHQQTFFSASSMSAPLNTLALMRHTKVRRYSITAPA